MPQPPYVLLLLLLLPQAVLTDNLLLANASPQQQSQLALLGNSFASYQARWAAPQGARPTTKRPDRLLQLVEAGECSACGTTGAASNDAACCNVLHSFVSRPTTKRLLQLVKSGGRPAGAAAALCWFGSAFCSGVLSDTQRQRDVMATAVYTFRLCSTRALLRCHPVAPPCRVAAPQVLCVSCVCLTMLMVHRAALCCIPLSCVMKQQTSGEHNAASSCSV
jgi:hypothetical protein